MIAARAPLTLSRGRHRPGAAGDPVARHGARAAGAPKGTPHVSRRHAGDDFTRLLAHLAERAQHTATQRRPPRRARLPPSQTRTHAKQQQALDLIAASPPVAVPRPPFDINPLKPRKTVIDLRELRFRAGLYEISVRASHGGHSRRAAQFEEAPQLRRRLGCLSLRRPGLDPGGCAQGDRELLANFFQRMVGVHADAEA